MNSDTSFTSENRSKQICNRKGGSIHGANTTTINRIRDEDMKSLIARKKLHLVLDLDNTLLHSQHILKLSTHDRQYLTHPWFKHKKLYNVQDWIIKLRPNVRTFLDEVSKLFDMSVFTLGRRQYAKYMLDILDPEKLYFANSQVITREDCTTPMKKELDLVLSHERVTLVVDDTQEVWGHNARRNLIKIDPYDFFEDVSSATSWSRLQQDESGKYGELARVLSELKQIHGEFYNLEGSSSKEGEDYESRDVRDVVDEVRGKFKRTGTQEFYFSSMVSSMISLNLPVI